MPSRNNSARDTRRERQRLASLNAFLQTDTTHNRSSPSTLQISSSLSSSGNTLRGVTQPSSTIHGCFEQWVFIHPERTALICSDGRRLSFLVLNRMANRLARMLLKYGVPDRSAVVAMSSPQPSSSKTQEQMCVGVCATGHWSIVAMLAVMKTGNAYVPLDPKYPAARLKFMVQDAGIRIVISEAHLRISHISSAALFSR